MRVTSFILLATACSAQELTSANGDVVVVRRQQISIGELADQVAQVPTLIARAQTQSNDMAWRATINATSAMTGRLDSIQSDMADLVAANEAAQTRMQEQMASAMASQTVVMSTMQSNMAAQMSEQVSAMVSTSAGLTGSVSTQQSAAQSTVTATLSRSAATTTQLVNQMNSTMIVALASKASSMHHMWIGYCNQHLYANGNWRQYCLSNPLRDDLAPYARKNDNNWFRVLRRGYFRINYFGIGESCNWNHVRSLARHPNGNEYSLDYGHSWTDWQWHDLQRDTTWMWVPNSLVGISIYGQCNRIVSHAGGRESSHSRISFQWVGGASE